MKLPHIIPRLTLPKKTIWHDTIRMLMRDDPVGAGEDGPTNIPNQQIADRTEYLKENLEILSEQVNAGFILVSSFEKGYRIDLANEVLLYEADGQYYRWTGDLSKDVPADSTPESTGGFGGGAWVLVGDGAFISALKKADGAKYIGSCKSIDELRMTVPHEANQLIIARGYYEQYLIGGGVFYSIKNNTSLDDNGYIIRCSNDFIWKRLSKNSYVDPVEFGALPRCLDSDFDSTVAFQNAINYASSSKKLEVKFDGEFNIFSFLHTFTLPFDNGVISVTDWLSNGDINISSEEIKTIPVSLKVPDHIKLCGINADASLLKGKYAITDGFSLGNGVLIACESGFDKTVFRTQFENFTITNSMIAILANTLSNINCEKMIFSHVGYCIVAQGAERSRFINLRFIHCYAGIILGGWWLQRERQNVSEIRAGWVDACYFDGVQFQGVPGKYIATDNNGYYQADVFFNDIFYKDANSITFNDGGRSSNNVGAYFLQETMDGSANFNAYHGIESRGVCIFSRYNRRQSANIITNGKALYTHRAPFYHNCPNQCYANYLFVEQTGFTDTQNKSGSFGATDIDPFSNKQTPIVSDGFYVDAYTHVVSCPPNRYFSDGSYDVKQPPPGFSAEFSNNLSFNNHRICYVNGKPSKTIIDRVSVIGDAIPQIIKTTNNKLYEYNTTYAITQPLHFAGNNQNALFDYNEVSFTPTISINNNEIVPTSAYGVVIKLGVLIKCFININKNGGWQGYSGNITIGNIPFSHVVLLNAARATCNITMFPSSTINALTASVNKNVITLREANGIQTLNANVINTNSSAIQLCIEFTTERLGIIAN